jgi:protein TonB
MNTEAADFTGMFAPPEGHVGRQEATPATAAYYEAEVSGGSFSFRITLALVERLEKQILETARDGGTELGGVLLGAVAASGRCFVIEDYQTVTGSSGAERLCDSGHAALDRALALWRSDPDGKIRAIGLFRTGGGAKKAPTAVDSALFARCLPEPATVLLLIGFGRDDEAEATLYLAEGGQIRRRAACTPFPWSHRKLTDQSGTVPPQAAHRRREDPTGGGTGRRGSRALGLIVASGVAAALLGAGSLGYRPSVAGVASPPAPSGLGADRSLRGFGLDLEELKAIGASVRILPEASEASGAPVAAPKRAGLNGGRKTAALPALQALARLPDPPVSPDARDDSVSLAPASIPEAGEEAAAGAAIPAPVTSSRSARETARPTPVVTLPLPLQRKGTTDESRAAVERRPAPAAPQVGGQFRPPVLIREVQPSYPQIALREHVSGVVEIGATVGRDGRLRDVLAISGPAALQEAAVQAVRGWRYRPALLDGNQVETAVLVKVVFRLQDR